MPGRLPCHRVLDVDVTLDSRNALGVQQVLKVNNFLARIIIYCDQLTLVKLHKVIFIE